QPVGGLPAEVQPVQLDPPAVLLGGQRRLGGGDQVLGQVPGQLAADAGQVVAAPPVVHLALDAVAAPAVLATQPADTNGAETVKAEAVFRLGKQRGTGQQKGEQEETKTGHGVPDPETNLSSRVDDPGRCRVLWNRRQ